MFKKKPKRTLPPETSNYSPGMRPCPGIARGAGGRQRPAAPLSTRRGLLGAASSHRRCASRPWLIPQPWQKPPAIF